MKLILIAAMDRNRSIGKDGRIPWHISEDLKRFKRLTVGHTVLMGRKTFESIGKPLVDRRNVVLTSHSIPGTESYASLDDALRALKSEEKVFVIGGGEIFLQTLDLASELFLTLVDQDVGGDTFFPDYAKLVKDKFRLAREDQRDGFKFVDYVRRSS